MPVMAVNENNQQEPTGDYRSRPRWSAGKKMEAVLRLLRGEPLETLSRELALKEQRDAGDLLDAEVGRDPAAAAGLTAHAHLFAIAQPVGAPTELLQRVIGGSGPQGWHDFLHSQVRAGSAGRPLNPRWVPDVPEIGDPTRRARGWALRSYRMTAGRTVEVLPAEDERLDRATASIMDAERYLLDLEVNEDGGLRLFCGKASDTIRGGVECVIDGLIIGLTKRLVLIAETIVATTGWLGSWDFGIAVTGLRGLLSMRLIQQGQEYLAAPFSEEGYRETVRATGERVVKDADGIVAELTGRLNRALGGLAPAPQ